MQEVHIHNIDSSSIENIESERNITMALDEFQEWCRQYNIGSRVERVSEGKHRATELMNQYTNYPKWVSRKY
jgi:hypothetical protein